MTDLHTQGRRNRTRGHQFERDVANVLAEATGLAVVTRRSVQGGWAAGSDVVVANVDGTAVVSSSIDGWSIEVKTGEPHKPTPWLAQAKAQADSRLWCVIAKRDRKPTLDATVWMPLSAFVWWQQGVTETDESAVFVSLRVFYSMLCLPSWEQVG